MAVKVPDKKASFCGTNFFGSVQNAADYFWDQEKSEAVEGAPL